MGRQTPLVIAPGALQGPRVQAGADFTVDLDQAIDSASTPAGTQFTATVQRPLTGQDGVVVVAAGRR